LSRNWNAGRSLYKARHILKILERSREVHDRKSAWVTVFLLVLVVVALPRLLHAQTTSALTGTVTDSTGAVLPGATISLESPSLIGGKHSTVTDSQGFYRFPAIPPGIYKVTAELQGFRTISHEDIHLALGQNITVDIGFSQATAAETVQVLAESPMVDI
jgi:hypothetical protein